MKTKITAFICLLCLTYSNRASAQLENYDTLISQYLTQQPESGFMVFQKPNNFPPGGLFQIYQDSTGDVDNALEPVSNHTDSLIKFHHFKYKQTYKGLDVEGAGMIEHFDVDWSLDYTQSKLATNIDMEVQPTIKQGDILSYLIDHLGSETEYAWNDSVREVRLQEMANDPNATHYPMPELLLMIDNYKDVLYEIPASRYKLAYKIHMVTVNPYHARDFYLDAHTGAIIKTRDVGDRYSNGICGAYGYGTNNVIDTKLEGNIFLKWYLIADNYGHNYETRWFDTTNEDPDWDNCGKRTSTTNNWGVTYQTSTSSHYFVGAAWDYFAAAPYHKIGLGNPNGELHIRVHWEKEQAKIKYHPITWQTPRLTYGKQNGFDYSWEPSIVIHEYIHGIVAFTSNLEYEFESGALNESFADIFGTIVQAKALDNNTTDWLFGNNITLPTDDKRSLISPQSYGKHHTGGTGATHTTAVGQPDTYLGTYWYNGTDFGVDRGAIHYNSGVQNHMFYILSEGASNTNDIGDYYYVTGIGMDDAEKIAYLAMTSLMQTSQYSDSRMAWIQAAINLFGYCSQQHKSTVDAWYAVGVGNHSGCPPLSVEELRQTIRIYPNPANTVFSISADGVNITNDIEVYSINGNLVKTIYPSNLNQIDISDLSTGIYFVKVNISDKIISRKIIIQANE